MRRVYSAESAIAHIRRECLSAITVLSVYTQGLNSHTLLFGYFQYFSILFMFLSSLFRQLCFQKYIFLTILNFKNSFANLHVNNLWEFFHCVFNLVNAIKSEQLAVFSFAKRRKFSLSRAIFFFSTSRI